MAAKILRFPGCPLSKDQPRLSAGLAKLFDELSRQIRIAPFSKWGAFPEAGVVVLFFDDGSIGVRVVGVEGKARRVCSGLEAVLEEARRRWVGEE